MNNPSFWSSNGMSIPVRKSILGQGVMRLLRCPVVFQAFPGDAVQVAGNLRTVYGDSGKGYLGIAPAGTYVWQEGLSTCVLDIKCWCGYSGASEAKVVTTGRIEADPFTQWHCPSCGAKQDPIDYKDK